MPATAYKLTIPKPCHNSWQDMTPNEKGRYCLSCNKTVTDFTQLSDTEITNYFIQHKDEGTCGRFYKKQLDRITIHIPTYVLQKRLPAWKRFLIVLLVCFGSTMFAVEVKAGNTVHTETTTKKPKLKLHRYRRWHFKSKPFSLPADMMYETLGYTVTTPVATMCPPEPGISSLLKEQVTAATTKENKKPSPFKKPLPPIAAVLPTALAAKRRKRR